MRHFSQNIRLLKLLFFFSFSTHPVNSVFFSGSSKLQGSWYWWRTFYSLQPLLGKVGKCLFPGSLFDIGTSSFNASMELINPNYSWKNRVKQIKATQEKLLQWCILYSIAKEPNHGVKMRQFFFFLLPFVLYLSGFDFFNLSNFSKIPMMNSLGILDLGTP